MRKLGALLVCGCLALSLAGAAQSGLDVGVTEDAGKADGGAKFFSALAGAGLTVNRVSIPWSPKDPLGIDLKTELDLWMPQAQLSGVRIVFAVHPQNASDLTASPSAKKEFAAFVRRIAETYPAVKDFVIGNEPNQPRFWLPQFTSGKPVSAAAYMPVLARSYDALKAVDPAINVIGVGLSPRGNDRPFARDNRSRSPVRFLRDLGAAYRKSKRKKPLMDELAFHPYPARNDDSPGVGYAWPNAGLPNLDRVKQAVWDAFNGTAQPTVEGGKRGAKPLKLDLDEVGWQVEISPDLAPMYTGEDTKGTVPISEDTQAQYYSRVVNMASCDRAVRMLSFFHLTDELNLHAWQSGLLRADGTPRPAYEAIKQTLAATHGECPGTPKSWKHSTKVVKPYIGWPKLRKIKNGRWSLRAGAGEEATYRVGIFKAGTKKAALTRALVRGKPKALLTGKGLISAKKRVVYLRSRKLKPGRYVYAIRMVATMNTKRSSVFVSAPFRVAPKRK